MLDDAVAVRCIGELKPENLRIFFGLLQTVTCCPVNRLCLNHSDGKVPAIPEQVICTFLRTPYGAISDKHDAPVGEALLFTNLGVFPAGAVELGQYIRAAGVGFV